MVDGGGGWSQKGATECIRLYYWIVSVERVNTL